MEGERTTTPHYSCSTVVLITVKVGEEEVGEEEVGEEGARIHT